MLRKGQGRSAGTPTGPDSGAAQQVRAADHFYQCDREARVMTWKHWALGLALVLVLSLDGWECVPW